MYPKRDFLRALHAAFRYEVRRVTHRASPPPQGLFYMSPASEPQHLLVAEDDPLVSDLIRSILIHAGYSVTCCPDGQAALEALQANPDRFALLLSDIRMPRLSGVELTQQVSTHYPQLPVLLASGYPDDHTHLNHPAFHSAAFLSKPFRAQDLIALVGQLLNTPGSQLPH